MECGTDRNTGVDCGTCPDGTVCNLEYTCSPIVVQCQHRTCHDGADIALSPELGVGDYDVTVSNGTETESCTIEIDELSYFARCSEILAVRLEPARVFVEGAYEQLSIRVSQNENVLAEQQLELEYDAFHPAGEDCPPECQVAFVEVVLK